MPDITMCTNKLCFLNKKCYRYRAIPDPRYQSYANFIPIMDEASGVFDCDYFDKIQDGDKLQTVED